MKTVRLLFAFLLVLGTAPASAEENSATVEITGLKVEGFVSGNRYTVDAAFGQENNIAVPAPFTFIAPTSDEHRIYVKPAPGGSGLIKLFFTTNEDLVKSNIQFVPITVAMGETQERLKSLERLLTQAFVAAVPDPDRAEINTVQATEIGPYPAIEAIGRYDGGADGIVILRVVAIPHPESENGVAVIVNALTKNVEMETVADILKTDSSRALGTMRFLD